MNRLLLSVAALSAMAFVGQTDGWQSTFIVERDQWVSTGKNDYFILEPGYRAEYSGGSTRLVITVLRDTQLVDGVTTRVVEERETEDGNLIEVSRNFFAMDKKTRDVYYFGEDVDMYKNGKLTNHAGAWRSGENGAKFGLMMPAKPKVGRAYYQEVAPKVAMDRARIVAVDAAVTTAAKKYAKCIRIEETTPREPGAKEYKLYAKGVGLVQDSELKLVKAGKS